MNVKFLQVAKVELDDAVEYYYREKAGLGYEFLWEVLFAIDRIKQFPQAWQPFHENTRRCLLRRFPYGIIYLHEGFMKGTPSSFSPSPISTASRTTGLTEHPERKSQAPRPPN
jgi:hypothetical protein